MFAAYAPNIASVLHGLLYLYRNLPLVFSVFFFIVKAGGVI